MVVSATAADTDSREMTMKFFVLLAGYGEMPPWDELTPEQQAAGMVEHEAFTVACTERDGVEMLAGEALADGSAARTMRTRGGRATVTDGPFTEVAEQIGGFYLLTAPDLDTVVDLCAILPAYDIEVRPVIEV